MSKIKCVQETWHREMGIFVFCKVNEAIGLFIQLT